MQKLVALILALAAWAVFLGNAGFVFYVHVLQQTPWPDLSVSGTYLLVAAASLFVGVLALVVLRDAAEG